MQGAETQNELNPTQQLFADFGFNYIVLYHSYPFLKRRAYANHPRANPAELQAFIEFPYQLYKHDPVWVAIAQRTGFTVCFNQ